MMRARCSFTLAVALLLCWGAARPAVAADSQATSSQQIQSQLLTVRRALQVVPPDIATAQAKLASIRDRLSAQGFSTAAIDPIISDVSGRLIDDAEHRVQAMIVVESAVNGGGNSNAKATLDSVYASPALSQYLQASKPVNQDDPNHRLARWVGDRIHDLNNFLNNLFKTNGKNSPLTQSLPFLAILAVAVAAALLLVAMLVRFRRRPESKEGLDGNDLIDLDSRSHVEWRRAEMAAERRDWREAIRRVFRSALLEMFEHDLLALNPAWTNRKLLAHLSSQPELFPLFGQAAEIFQGCWYGGHDITQERWEQMRGLCLEIREFARGAAVA